MCRTTRFTSGCAPGEPTRASARNGWILFPCSGTGSHHAKGIFGRRDAQRKTKVAVMEVSGAALQESAEDVRMADLVRGDGGCRFDAPHNRTNASNDKRCGVLPCDVRAGGRARWRIEEAALHAVGQRLPLPETAASVLRSCLMHGARGRGSAAQWRCANSAEATAWTDSPPTMLNVT